MSQKKNNTPPLMSAHNIDTEIYEKFHTGSDSQHTAEAGFEKNYKKNRDINDDELVIDNRYIELEFSNRADSDE